MKRVKPVRSAAVVVRVFPEERDILRFNAGLHGMSMSDYIRQTCLGIRLRKTPEEKRRLRELARIGANINQLARWANTYKRTAEAVEVVTALAGIEALAAFIREIGLPATFAQLGIPEDTDLRAVADSTNITAGCCKKLTHDEIYEILLECR